MDMHYPPAFLSHHISLQLMLQREFHVITLALRSCPLEMERRRRRGPGGKMGEKGECG